MRVKPGYVAPELVPKYKAPHIVRFFNLLTFQYQPIFRISIREEERRSSIELPKVVTLFIACRLVLSCNLKTDL